MSEISRDLHRTEASKNSVGVVQRYQEFLAIPEPHFPNTDEPVPGRTAGAKAEWRIGKNSATFVCTCGNTTTWNELPVTDMLRGIMPTAKCCVVGRKTPFPVV